MSIDDDNPEQIWAENDRWHLESAFRWLDRYTDDSVMLYSSDRIDDFVDLNDGRDFLEESQIYDIVILHMVYSPYNQTFARNAPGSPYRISRLHTPNNWKRRLMATNAKYIFTFGDGEEVHGRYLGELREYYGPIDAGNYLDVYVSKLWAEIKKIQLPP